MYKHILIPTDGSDLSHKAVEAGIAFASFIHAKVTGFTAVPEYQIPSEAELMSRHAISLTDYERDAKKQAEITLQPIADRARAAGVQVGTPFAVTEEGDAHPEFKRVLAEARAEDIVTFMSVAGLPARAVRTPWLARYLEKEAVLQRRAKPRRECTLAFDCLTQCGLRDGNARIGQFCIDHHLAAALRGDVDHGLFFRGSESVPFGARIRPVRDLTEHLLGAPVH